MGQKDLTAKSLEAKPVVFADIFNGFLFYEDESLRLDPSLLRDLPTESVYYDADGNIRNMFQDSAKAYGEQQFVLACLGLENQSTVERYLTVRILGYVYSNYKRQLDSYTDRRKELLERKKRATPEEAGDIDAELEELGSFKLIPVVVLVLNFSGEDWNEPVSLSGLVEDGNPYKCFMGDFTIRVIDIHTLGQEDFERFTSDFGAVIRCLNSTSRDYDGVETTLTYPLETLDMIHAYKKIDNFAELRERILKNAGKGELITMGTIFDELVDEATRKGKQEGIYEGERLGRQEGERLGRQEGVLTTLLELVRDGLIPIEEAASRLQKSVEEVKTLL